MQGFWERPAGTEIPFSPHRPVYNTFDAIVISLQPYHLVAPSNNSGRSNGGRAEVDLSGSTRLVPGTEGMRTGAVLPCLKQADSGWYLG
jgi:hypothetical protein